MELNSENRLPETFVGQLSDIPPLPGHLYAGVMRKIGRRKVLARTLWAAAASVLIAVSLFTTYRSTAPREAYNPEISDEISCISSYFNSDDLQDDDNATYENVLYLP